MTAHPSGTTTGDVPPGDEPPSQSLFVDDRELHRRINPKMGWDRFRATVRNAELRDGFPRIDPVWSGRFWPEVEAWLHERHGARDKGVIGEAPDGRENF